MRPFRHLAAILSFALLPNFAHAYFSTMDTGEVTKVDRYRVIAEPQVIFNRYAGFNVLGRFATGLSDSTAVESIVGFGEVDFQLGGFFKWIPVPDVGDQPAIGGKVGILYARADGETELSLRLHPMVSKKFETEVGDITPFVSLPFGITNRDGDSYSPIQIAGGAEWKTLNWENLRFMAELGLNLNKSFSYLSVGLVYEFDEASMKVQ